MHETLQLLSAGPRRQASARTSAESDEACQRKTKDRADGMREKSAHCPRVCVRARTRVIFYFIFAQGSTTVLIFSGRFLAGSKFNNDTLTITCSSLFLHNVSATFPLPSSSENKGSPCLHQVKIKVPLAFIKWKCSLDEGKGNLAETLCENKPELVNCKIVVVVLFFMHIWRCPQWLRTVLNTNRRARIIAITQEKVSRAIAIIVHALVIYRTHKRMRTLPEPVAVHTVEKTAMPWRIESASTLPVTSSSMYTDQGNPSKDKNWHNWVSLHSS